jgi:hypothetical protein
MFSSHLCLVSGYIHTTGRTHIPVIRIGVLVGRLIVSPIAELDVEVLAVWLRVCISKTSGPQSSFRNIPLL